MLSEIIKIIVSNKLNRTHLNYMIEFLILIAIKTKRVFSFFLKKIRNKNDPQCATY